MIIIKEISIKRSNVSERSKDSEFVFCRETELGSTESDSSFAGL